MELLPRPGGLQAGGGRSLHHCTQEPWAPHTDNRKVRVGESGLGLHQQARKAGQVGPFPVLWVVTCEEGDKRRDRGVQSIWDLGLTLAQVHCVLLGKFLPISGPQFSLWLNKN